MQTAAITEMFRPSEDILGTFRAERWVKTAEIKDSDGATEEHGAVGRYRNMEIRASRPSSGLARSN